MQDFTITIRGNVMNLGYREHQLTRRSDGTECFILKFLLESANGKTIIFRGVTAEGKEIFCRERVIFGQQVIFSEIPGGEIDIRVVELKEEQNKDERKAAKAHMYTDPQPEYKPFSSRQKRL